MDKLPYSCKELINLYALNTFGNYESLVEFNKICDYKPCEYSPIKLQHAKKNYETKKRSFNNAAIGIMDKLIKKLSNVEKNSLLEQTFFDEYFKWTINDKRLNSKQKNKNLDEHDLYFCGKNRFFYDQFKKNAPQK